MSWLTNSWMASNTFDQNAAHVLAGYAAVLTVAHFHAGTATFVAFVVVFNVLAAAKEFWYDLRYELPKQTLDDSALDFFGYCAGIVIGCLVAAFG